MRFLPPLATTTVALREPSEDATRTGTKHWALVAGDGGCCCSSRVEFVLNAPVCRGLPVWGVVVGVRGGGGVVVVAVINYSTQTTTTLVGWLVGEQTDRRGDRLYSS